MVIQIGTERPAHTRKKSGPPEFGRSMNHAPKAIAHIAATMKAAVGLCAQAENLRCVTLPPPRRSARTPLPTSAHGRGDVPRLASRAVMGRARAAGGGGMGHRTLPCVREIRRC